MRPLVFLLFFALLAVACSDTASNDDQVQCRSNSECPSGVCDLESFTCEAAVARCGDGTVDDGETCDGNCTASCNDADACTTDSRSGDSAACNVSCANEPITACVDDDGCCAAGCDETNDRDCFELDPNCGNGVVDAGEECDRAIEAGQPGACPLSCAASPGSCVERVLEGNRQACDVQCREVVETACVSADGCCPDGCTSDDDDDCADAFFIGTSCQQNSDCSSSGVDSLCLTEEDASWTGGYCSKRCLDEADCPEGAVCAGTICIDSCGPDDPCRQGYECAPDPFNDLTRPVCVPIGKGGTGSACESKGDCLGGALGVECMLPAQDFKDGFCMPNCEVDEDCDGEARCREWNGEGRCLDPCTPPEPCRDGYSCHAQYFDLPATQNFCSPFGGGTTAVGDPCTGAFECEGGKLARCLKPSNGFADFEGGACSVIDCRSQFACPQGSSCSFLAGYSRLITEDTGLCLANCNTTSPSCRPGYACENGDRQGFGEQCTPTGTGTGQVGDACTSVADCAGGVEANCAKEIEEWQDGYCRLDCTTDVDCPSDSSCFAFPGEPAFCIDDCQSDGECRDGYLCIDANRNGQANCLPAGTGNGLVGDPCVGIFECSYERLAVCLYDWPGGHCSRVCGPFSAEPCPTGTYCGEVGGLPFPICVDECSGADLCRTGYYCGAVTRYDQPMTDQACLPL